MSVGEVGYEFSASGMINNFFYSEGKKPKRRVGRASFSMLEERELALMLLELLLSNVWRTMVSLT